jgi:F-type H+-transporting ATPase subunit c
MKKFNLLSKIALLPCFFAASEVFAEGLGESGGSSVGLAKLGAALAIGLGAAGAATGQGKAASAALEGIARNPASRSEVFVPLLLSLVFMEFQALLCFVIALNLAG